MDFYNEPERFFPSTSYLRDRAIELLAKSVSGAEGISKEEEKELDIIMVGFRDMPQLINFED